MYAVGPPAAQFLLHGPPSKVQPRLIEESAKLIQTRYPNHHWRRVSHSPEALLAFAQYRFGFYVLDNFCVHQRHAFFDIVQVRDGSLVRHESDTDCKPGHFRYNGHEE